MPMPFDWGVTSEERSMSFPCDRFADQHYAIFFRGVSVAAAPETVFRWLCQLRVAPYSYDWIDNPRRRSPQTLTLGLEDLAVGQTMMFFFELVDFERNRHITVRHKPNTIGARVFGDVLASYLIAPQAKDSCRLLVKAAIKYPPGLIGWLTRAFLPWGDFIMMRRQLLNFKFLSERTQSA